MKRKIIIFIILVSILCISCFIYFNCKDKSANENKIVETDKKMNDKHEKEPSKEVDNENLEENESLDDELSSETKSINNSSTNHESKTTTSSNSTTNKNVKANDNNKNYSSPTNTQNNNNQQQEVKQETPKPVVDNRTAWEKLGISEYEYYHTEMYGSRVDLYNTDISFCNSEAKRILNSYEDVANTRSYSGTGKYTYSYIGCSVDVTFYDGRTVGYNEAKKILGF